MAAVTCSAIIGTNAIAVASLLASSTVTGSASVGTNAIASARSEVSSAVTCSAVVGSTVAAVSSLEMVSAVSCAAVVGTNAIATADILVGNKIEWTASVVTTAKAAAEVLATNNVTASAGVGTTSFAVANIIGGSDTDGLSICDILDRTLEMWGIFCRKSASSIDFAIDRAVSDLNHALQLVWNNAEGRTYWTNETITVTVDADASSEDLPDNIQNVTGTCRRADNKQPLTLIGTIGELETFNHTFLDGEQADTPIAYHIERLKQSGNEPARCIFHVNQAVDANTDFLLEVVREAPRYSKSDLDSCPLLPIPHQYVESLLLPVVRYQASNFFLFRQPEQKDDIKSEYAKAMEQLGLADPLPNLAGDNRKNGGEG